MCEGFPLPGGAPSSTTNYFGESMSYNTGFTNTQLNGNIARVQWKAAGDLLPRAYGYTYDNTNRLTTANFSQQNSGSTALCRCWCSRYEFNEIKLFRKPPLGVGTNGRSLHQQTSFIQ